MRHLSTLIAGVLSLALLQGQEKPAPPENQTESSVPGTPNMLISAVIHVQTLDGDSFDRLVRLLKVFGAQTEADNHLRTIVVYGKPEVVAQIRRVVKQLDQPGSEAALGRNMEMTLTFLRCSIKAPAAAPPALPPDIEAAAKQLKALTQYKYITVLEVLPLHLQEGKETTETLQLSNGDQAADAPNSPGAPTVSIWIQPDSVYQKEQTRYVRFQRMQVNMKVPHYTGTAPAGQWSFNDVGLKTAGDFAEGQKTVLGKLSGTDQESAIFIVVALKVLD